ncbi:MAG TPA: hypothetical protein VMQ65_10335 [Candidatus Limnocylindria bacterium]|nr:hypothetical protein [Candidatus Limnocylindria bacterium]
MNTALRDGLVEVPGALPTFASAGLEARAAVIDRIAADSHAYIAGQLGFSPETQVLVLSEGDWPSRTETPVYGLPNASNGTLVVAGTEAPLWDQLTEMVAAVDRPELARVYGGDDGVIRLGPFFDLVAVHEVAHVFHEGTQHFPRLWLQELFANLCLHSWVAERSPESLPILMTLPTLGAKAAPETFTYRTREDFERLYSGVGGENYVWYQFRLQLEAAALFDRAGAAAVARLFEAFRLDDAALARKLEEAVDPGLAAFSLAF